MSCEAAVPCYIRALESKPQYPRALSNLGISYGNLHTYDAAAQCYLKVRHDVAPPRRIRFVTTRSDMK